MKSIIIKNRRFTCLSPTLVRVEYSPDGSFENRRSMVAYPEKKPMLCFPSTPRYGKSYNQQLQHYQ
jgi:hypothetical protein